MTNLDSICKSRDITLPTKVLLVKAMVFPVVMYGCDSWTIKKAEPQRINTFVVLEKTLEDDNTLMAENEEELKSLLMKVKEGVKKLA